MAKYTEETVKEIPTDKIAEELLIAQQENIAKANSDVRLIQGEITRRLQEAEKITSKEQVPANQGGWKDAN